jgi:septum formation protein
MTPTAPIILASTSPIRRSLLEGAGIRFSVQPPQVDENLVKTVHRALAPRQLVWELAHAKAQAVSQQHPSSLVIGADQVLVLQDKIFDKPRTIEEAKTRLRQLRGKDHALITSVSCSQGVKSVWHITERAVLSMRDFSESFLEDYATTNAADMLASVGAYKLESNGIQLFTRIQGDYFTILGLPLLPLLGFLRERGLIPT